MATYTLVLILPGLFDDLHDSLFRLLRETTFAFSNNTQAVSFQAWYEVSTSYQPEGQCHPTYLMKNLLLQLLLCASFGLQAGDNTSTLPMMPANDFCAGAIPITPSEAGANCTVASFTLPFSTDGTTDSGVPTVCREPVKDQWFTWTATTDGLNFASSLDNSAGIAIFASCDAANTGQAISCFGPLGSGVLSGWDIGDEIIIQVYDIIIL